MRKNISIIFNVIAVPLDYLMIFAAGLFAYSLRVSPWVTNLRPAIFETSLPFKSYLMLVIIFALATVLVLAFLGLYRIEFTRQKTADFIRIIIGLSFMVAFISIYAFFNQYVFESRFLVLAAWFMSIIFLMAERIGLNAFLRFLIGRFNLGVCRVLLIGADGFSQKIGNFYMRHPELGYRVVKRLRDPDLSEITAATKNPGVDEIILADPNFNRDEVVDIINFSEDNRINFRFVPNIFQILTVNAAVNSVDDVPLIELRRTALDTWGGIAKRIFDFIAASVGVIILSPVFLTVAFLIKWDSAGPVFVRLKRISQGRTFYMYKFRSMVKNADKMKEALLRYNERKDGPLFKMANDPRITQIGKVLRKTRIDELPQLLNVVFGDMSLVGPRPHEPGEVSQYQRHHKKVLAIKSGVTGMAQVAGSSDLPFEEEIKLDTFYVEHWSFWLDLVILSKTVLKVLAGDKSAA